MNKKEYWLYGLVTGFVIYLLIILYVYISVGDGAGTEPWGRSIILVDAVLFSPIILIGLFSGWLYGKIKNRNKLN